MLREAACRVQKSGIRVSFPRDPNIQILPTLGLKDCN